MAVGHELSKLEVVSVSESLHCVSGSLDLSHHMPCSGVLYTIQDTLPSCAHTETHTLSLSLSECVCTCVCVC